MNSIPSESDHLPPCDGRFHHIATIPLPAGRRCITVEGDEWDIVALVHVQMNHARFGVVDDYMPIVLTDQGAEVLSPGDIVACVGQARGRRRR
ncbi:hypothetical protein ACERK3_16915 [Phycisphaerales bacterium AB-hyl4]|uniref:Uncharacterized protein n=1 Tax=Natronomicrosphaera hydrolytica TaxID=3242702 RepID=A0ABV4UBB5_9BACT